jgi:iron complex outermembrane receptor protein
MRPFRIAALLAVSTTALAAQQQDSISRRLAPVAVTARQESRVIGGAAAIQLSTDSLRVAPATNLDVALRQVPFVGVKTNSRGETELSVRGSESRTPAVLVDGANLSIGWDSRTDVSIIPLTAATGIRVTRGLSSLMLGPNITGGTVEVGLAEGVDRMRSALLVGADHTGALSTSAVFGAPVALGPATLAVIGGAGYRDRPDVPAPPGAYDGDDDGRILNSDFRQQDLFGSARLSLRQGAFVGATVATASGERGVIPELSVAAPRYWRLPTLDRSVAIFSAGTGALRSPLGVASLDVRAAQNEIDLLIETYRDRGYRDVSAREGGAERTRSIRVIGEHSLGGRGEIGVSYSSATVEYTETLFPAAPVDYEQRLNSLAFETDWDLPGATALTLSFATDRAENPKTGGRTPLPERSEWAGRVGVDKAFAGGARLHASASRRARFPALRELYSGALNRFEPNPNLRPEMVNTIETGATVSRGGAQVQATVFQTRIDDGIVRTTLPNRRFFRVNLNRVTTVGIETAAQWRFAGAQFLADLTLQDPQATTIPTSTLTRPEYQPHARGSVTGVFPVTASTRLTTAVNVTGSQYCLNVGTGAQERVKPFTRVDLLGDRSFRVGTGLWSSVRAMVGVDNALDQLGYDICGVPQIGRTWRVGLELR